MRSCPSVVFQVTNLRADVKLPALKGRIPGSQTNLKKPFSELKIPYVGFFEKRTTI
jgi:hypothetical protein